MFKQSFLLKQHMPILHFQHDQYRPTLRASEVKPRLDRYIIEQNHGFKSIPQEWKLDSCEGEALHYKMKITMENQNEILDAYTRGSFFGNQGENSNKYRLLFSKDPVKLEIITYSKSLEKEFCRRICGFFNENTFGARQSKGFGFFYPENDSEAFRDFKGYLAPSHNYFFTIENLPVCGLDSRKRVADLINLFYSSLRSGFNRLRGIPKSKNEQIDGKENTLITTNSEFYCKPAIFQYLKLKIPNSDWDKRRIKEEFFNTEYIKRKASSDKKKKYDKLSFVYTGGLKKQLEKYRQSDILRPFNHSDPVTNNEVEKKNILWRDLFGLSLSQKWGSYGAELEKKHISKDNPQKNDSTKEDEFEIKRFQSPIRFFPVFNEDGISCTVFIDIKTIPEYYLNSEFTVSMTGLKHYKPVQFFMGRLDLSEFLDWIIEEHTNKNLLPKMVQDENMHDHVIYKDLELVYDHIKKNKNHSE